MKNLNLKTRGLKIALMCFPLFFYTLANSQSININNYELVSKKTFPTIKDDLSGITYSSETKTLFMVQNDTANIYEITTSGNIIRTIKLTDFDDTEGITHISGPRFAVAEEKKGRIVFFDIEQGTTEIKYDDTDYAQLPDFYGPWRPDLNNGLEGLTYNRVTNQIVTLKEHSPKGYFAFDLPTSFPAELSVSDVKIPCNIASAPFNGLLDLAGIQQQGNSAFILSQVNKVVVHVSSNCSEISRLSLAEMNHPEGIAFANDTLYVVGEKNELFIFSPPCVIGSACDDGDDCTENDMYDEACGCVGTPINDCGTCRQIDSLTLVSIYKSLNREALINPSKPLNEWFGVSLNENGCISELRLVEAKLKGEFPVAIGKLKELTHLDLSENHIRGQIPPEIGNLTNLKFLNIGENDLQGQLPSTIGNLSDLEVLGACCNDLITIPESIGNLNELNVLGLTRNRISEIPASIGNLVNLAELYLSSNQIKEIPTTIGNLVNLNRMRISYNQLTELPVSFGNLINLNYLYVDNNQLFKLTDSFSNLSNLITVYLSNNQLSTLPLSFSNLINLKNLRLDNNLFKELPNSINNLPQLSDIWINNNQIAGQLPSWLAGIPNLSSLLINNNKLNGCYANELTKLCSQLWQPISKNEYISDGNNLEASWEDFCSSNTGICPIPNCHIDDWTALKAIYESTNGDNWTNRTGWDVMIANQNYPSANCDLSKLYGVFLYGAEQRVSCIDLDGIGDCGWEVGQGNNLNGNLPSDIGKLSNLDVIMLSNNQIGGNIPSEMGNLERLEAIFLDNNEFSGSIPEELGKLNSTEVLFLNNNKLGGTIPTELSNIPPLVFLNLSNNMLNGNIPLELINGTSIRELDLSYNKLSGSIPAGIDELNLEKFVIAFNQLSGCYPNILNQLCDQLSDNEVSEGNNFDATWKEFCATGNGNCTPSCRQTDSLALVEIYQSLEREIFIDTTKPLNEWYGVKLNENGCIAELYLADTKLRGELPAAIGDFSELTYLDLNENYISGSIPSEIGNLTNLNFLNINENKIEGPLPNSIGNLVNLEVLTACCNRLTKIPESIGSLSELTELNLAKNKISKIPASVGNLIKLKELSLSSNQLTGIPYSVGNLVNITKMYLNYNQLKELPVSIGNLVNLSYLNIESNHLTNLPDSFGNLNNLTTVYLSNNQLSTLPISFSNLINLKYLRLDNNLLKELPSSISNLPQLSNLWTNNNQITGQLPSWVAGIPNLSSLQVQNNKLSGCYANELNELCSKLWQPVSKNAYISDGNNFDASWENFCSSNAGSCPIPNCHINDWTALKALYESTNGDNWTNRTGWDVIIDDQNSPPSNCDLSQLEGVFLDDKERVSYAYLWFNNLHGELPPEIGMLNNLEGLWLSGGNNFITGSIPPEIGKLSNLKSLSIDNNKLSGEIPPEIGMLNNLVSLFLHENNFSGNIPPEIGKLDNLKSLSLFGNELTGNIPSEISNLKSLTDLVLINNQFNGCYANELNQLCNQISPKFFIFMIGGVDPINYGNNFDIGWEEFCAGTSCTSNKLNNEQAFDSYNYPNPFSTHTTINYALPVESEITLTIYDAHGNQVAQLLDNEKQKAGEHTAVFDSHNFPVGVYYYYLQSNTKNELNKIVLVK